MFCVLSVNWNPSLSWIPTEKFVSCSELLSISESDQRPKITDASLGKNSSACLAGVVFQTFCLRVQCILRPCKLLVWILSLLIRVKLFGRFGISICWAMQRLIIKRFIFINTEIQFERCILIYSIPFYLCLLGVIKTERQYCKQLLIK